ncbi:hypothetical protein [Pigmentiphaga litoralis]|uniref:hypothetical protein n=1 Tax=Pigmentiphaga litoralis TaxID=516702 RepID=UPI003B435FCF
MTRATPAKVILGIAHRRDPGSSFGIAVAVVRILRTIDTLRNRYDEEGADCIEALLLYI